jgi:hypothetical protein
MHVDFKSDSDLQRFDQRFQIAIGKFFRASAHRANQVMPVRSRNRRVTVTLFRQVNALNVTQFHQQIERAIHRRQTEMRIFDFGLAIDLGGRQVPIGARQSIKHGLARSRQFTMVLAQVLVEGQWLGHWRFFLNENDFQLHGQYTRNGRRCQAGITKKLGGRFDTVPQMASARSK